MISANELNISKFKNIPNWDMYLISDCGRIYSIISGKWMKTCVSTRGYEIVSLQTGLKKKTWLVHRLVALSYIPNPENKRTVNHKDGDKLNNQVDNLEWNTHSENCLHAVTKGLIVPPKLGFGENHPASKLSDIDVSMIRVLLQYQFSQDDIAKRFGVHPVNISQIKLGKSWKQPKSALTGTELTYKP